MNNLETCHQTGQHFRQKKGNEFVDLGDAVTYSTHAPGRGIIPLNDTSAIIGARWSDVLRILSPCKNENRN